jgi:hypothetical protein
MKWFVHFKLHYESEENTDDWNLLYAAEIIAKNKLKQEG